MATKVAVMHDEAGVLYAKKEIGAVSPLHIEKDGRLFWMTGNWSKGEKGIEVYYRQCRGPKKTLLGKMEIR